jgi:hypothetical protein
LQSKKSFIKWQYYLVIFGTVQYINRPKTAHL